MIAELDIQGRRIVVTGGTGFLGRYICEELQTWKADVRPVGSLDYDLCEQAAVRRLYADLQPSIVVHGAAACGGIQANEENPGLFLYANAVMGLMLLEEGRRAGLDKLVLMSTTCAYPQNAPLPFSEEHISDGPPTGTTGPYGLAKRLLHEACANYEKQYGLRSTVLVPSNLYGPGDHFDEQRSHVVAALIRRFVEAKRSGTEQVVNWGTGKPTREFIHVRDAARGVVLACRRETSSAPINLGTGQETSIRELSDMIMAIAGYEGHVAWDETKPDGQPKRYMNVDRAKKVLGFESRIDLRQGLEETIRWFENNL